MRKLFLILTLVVALLIGSSSLACGPDDQCTLIKGSKVIQIMSDQTIRGITVPEDISISIGPELGDEIAAGLTAQTGMDWTGANFGIVMIDFGNGPVPVVLLIKESDVKNCTSVQ